MEHFIQNDAECPDIHSIGIALILGLFRSYVLLGACQRLHDHLLGAEPEISDFNVGDLPFIEFSLQQDVLRLQIPVGDFVVVQHLDALGDAHAQLHGLVLIHAVARYFGEALPQGPAFTEFGDIEHHLIGLLYFVYFEDVGALDLHEIPVDGLLLEQILHILGALVDGPDRDVALELLTIRFVHLHELASTFAKLPSPMHSAFSRL
jgi:hypothetical protein